MWWILPIDNQESQCLATDPFLRIGPGIRALLMKVVGDLRSIYHDEPPGETLNNGGNGGDSFGSEKTWQRLSTFQSELL